VIVLLLLFCGHRGVVVAGCFGDGRQLLGLFIPLGVGFWRGEGRACG